MRRRRRHDTLDLLGMAPGEDTRYCVLCQTVMLFERVDAADLLDDAAGAEWVCVTCGSAVFVDPPVQAGGRSA
ncbi:MAG TPA: hypothetical protein VGJ44_03270 [Kribbellaceae bacterium]